MDKPAWPDIKMAAALDNEESQMSWSRERLCTLPHQVTRRASRRNRPSVRIDSTAVATISMLGYIDSRSLLPDEAGRGRSRRTAWHSLQQNNQPYGQFSKPTASMRLFISKMPFSTNTGQHAALFFKRYFYLVVDVRTRVTGVTSLQLHRWAMNARSENS